MKWINQIGLLFLLILPFSCADSETAKNEEMILGRWELKQAVRNGKMTDALKGIFFDFKEEGKMVSNFNFNAEEQALDYTINKKVLAQKGTENLTYAIEKISTTELILSTEYKKFKFELQLEK